MKPWRKKTLVTAKRRNRERLKMGKAVLHLYTDMKPRSKSDPAPKPSSAYAIYLGVKALHDIRSYEMVSVKMVARVVKGLVRRHVMKWGHQSLLVKRKEPFTFRIIMALTAFPKGTELGVFVVDDQYVILMDESANADCM